MAEFDDLAVHYDETRGGERRGDEYAAAIDALLPAGDGPILDIGVGTGVVALGLARRGRQVIGLDVSAPMLSIAQRRIGSVLLQSDAMNMAIATASVAHAVSVWVVQSVADPVRLFEEAARVLAPGGTFVVCPSQRHTDDVIGDIMAQLAARIDSRRGAIRPRAVTVDQVVGWAARAGLVGIVHGESREWTGSPADDLRAIEQRIRPALRELDEDAIQEVTAPAVEALRALPQTAEGAARGRRHRRVPTGQREGSGSLTGLPDRSDPSQLSGRILFVCTGNQCRSPMAEALLRAKLPSGSGIVVESAGTAGDGTPPPDEVVGVMADRGLDIAGRPSRRVDPAGLERADLIVAMSREHLIELMTIHPDARHQSFTFTDLLDRARKAGGPVGGESLSGWARRLDGGRTTASILSLPAASDVGDPMGGPARGYEETARVLDRLTTELSGFLYPASESADALSGSPDDKEWRPRWSSRRSKRN